jgi:hypothetical protein
MVTCQCALSVRSAAVDRPLTVAAEVSETEGSPAAQSLSTFQNLASSSLSTWPASEISRVLATEVVVQSVSRSSSMESASARDTRGHLSSSM